ncbi:hypothetical protein Scel_32070 [Streptomyces cellostaticus]|nr:hypothetical protein Scel_32070 [Streptomyces cellostaticus]
MNDHIHFPDGEFRGPVIGKKVEYHRQAPAPTALNALPAKTAGFTGRDDELARLRDALDPAGGSGEPQAVLVTAVSGLGGIGKTALAVEASYAARKKGWFPGGELFVDLHGYDDAPVTADQALQSLLRALGVEPKHIPDTADERAVLYRSTLAERDPVLILADNASSPDQVRPLLPGGTRHRVLVTSRDRLPQLGARLVPLEQLTPEASCALLDRALRIAAPGDTRVTDDPGGAGRLAALCGHLPLALQIAAALLAEDPDQPVAELVAELAASHDRLASLNDGERSVRAAFDLSYRRLPAEQARLLCLLALVPGPEVSDEVAAALAGSEVPPLRDLRALARTHLVERGSGRGRWRMHDLVRAFGSGVVALDAGLREEGEAARERVLRFYCHWAYAADKRVQRLPGLPETEQLADRGQALAWLDGERAGLVAAVLWGREKRYADMAVRLSLRLAVYFSQRRYFDDWLTVARAALEAAHLAGDGAREAHAWTNLSVVLLEAGHMEEAIEVSSRARDVCRAAGNRDGEASALNSLGVALLSVGQIAEAFDAHSRACDLFQAVGDHVNEAVALHNIGHLLIMAGRAEEAIEVVSRARDVCQAAGNRHREASAWSRLGVALLLTLRGQEAIEACGQALEIFREFEDWYGFGEALVTVAFAHKQADRLAEARACWLEAADAYAHGNAHTEAAEARALADEITAPAPPPEPTDRPTPASPPARTPASAQPAPPPPDAPDTAGP